MTDEIKKTGQGGGQPAHGDDAPKADAVGSSPGAAQQAGAGNGAAGAAGQGAEDQSAAGARVTELEGQIADLTDRLLRAHADLDNLRKRMEREKEETAKYAISKFALAIVGVSDNFERAIGSVPAAAVTEGSPLKALLEGVSMTEREFLNVLDRHGVKRIDPKGEPFNPHQHQAVVEAQDPSVPAGTVTQVFQPGYMIDDRCLRPAMVVVAKGGPKGARPADTAVSGSDVPPTAAGTQQG